MPKKTNKTSHVMDLLTNGASQETEENAEPVSEAALAGQEKKSDVQSHTVTPAKVTVVDEGSRNDRISQEILGKLTEELEAETQKGQPREDTTAPDDMTGTETADIPAEELSDSLSDIPESDSETLISEESEIMEDIQETFSEDISTPEEDVQQETVQDNSEQIQPNTQNTSSKQEIRSIFPHSHFAAHAQDHSYQFINIMEQVLMRQDLESELKKYGVCTCPRCMSDVCALVLTRLPSKYVVTDQDSISPLLSYYENKYKIQILTQLMMSCDKVRENPRHVKD